LHWLSTIEHSLDFECPSSKPVLEIFECFETFSSAYDLWWVVATEKCIWGLSHLLGSNTETDHGMINDSVILHWPQVVQLFLAHILVRGKSKDSIWVFTKTLRFVESQELEVGTLIVLQLHCKFSQTSTIYLVRLCMHPTTQGHHHQIDWT
jgi:hypothetical protein